MLIFTLYSAYSQGPNAPGLIFYLILLIPITRRVDNLGVEWCNVAGISQFPVIFVRNRMFADQSLQQHDSLENTRVEAFAICRRSRRGFSRCFADYSS